MSVLLAVRHSSAGDRAAWIDDDDHRPLDDLGRRQAEWLIGVLSDRQIGRILSSPAVRCVQTVDPLAAARGVELEVEPGLAEGASAAALALVTASRTRTWCSARTGTSSDRWSARTAPAARDRSGCSSGRSTAGSRPST